MSTSEVKKRLANMSQEDRDDIRSFLESMDKPKFEISAEMEEELLRRRKLYESGKMSTRPAAEIIDEWRKKIQTIK